MSLSVIIPCYNCADEIGGNIRAILESTHTPDEIILVDDASMDGTLAELRRLAGVSAGKPNIVVVAQAVNGGPAKARNAGANAASGEYLFFLDSDTQVLPDAFKIFLAWQGRADAVVGIYDSIPLNDAPSAHYKALLYGHLLGKSGIVPYDQFSASCAGIRTATFRAVGGYNETFPRGLDFENEELGHRISAAYTMLLDPGIKARHRFPGFGKMTSTFFQRTALWVESFLRRRRFNSVAGTPSTGIASLCLAGAVAAVVFSPFCGPLLWGAAILYAVFIRGYAGFLLFVLRERPSFILSAIMLCHYYTLVIATGAMAGAIRYLVGAARLGRIVEPAE